MSGESMKAAVYRGRGELEFIDMPVPQPGSGEVLVEVSFCGVCGTDLHNVLDGWGVKDVVGGHEWSGLVVAAGDGVDVEVGQAVIGGPDRTCGTCAACLSDRPNLCRSRGGIGTEKIQGAFAEFVAVDADEIVSVPADIEPRLAAYAEPLAVALHAVTVGEASAGDDVLVFGAGPIGAAVTAVLVSRGHRVRVVEPSERRRDLARRLGAETLLAESLETSAHPGDIAEDPADLVFEASGVKAAFESGLGQLRRGGRLVQVGNGMNYPTLDTNRMILNELVVTGAFTYDATGFDDALNLIGSGTLPLDVLIEPGTRPLSQLLDVMHELRDGVLAGKVMVQP